MITYTKHINSLQAYKNIDGETNVVFNINWDLVGEENGYTASCPSMTSVPYFAGQPFIPYADLTQADVEAWIDQYTPAEQMQTYQDVITESLANQQGKDSPPLPWVPESGPTSQDGVPLQG